MPPNTSVRLRSYPKCRRARVAPGAERLRTEAAPASRVNPAYLRGARRCRARFGVGAPRGTPADIVVKLMRLLREWLERDKERL